MSEVQVLTETIDYVSNAIVSKTILRKTTGSINLVAFDIGETLAEKTSPFDLFLHVVEGSAEVVINDDTTALEAGEIIIIPAHAKNMVRANKRFKMITTVIKSGYEGSIL